VIDNQNQERHKKNSEAMVLNFASSVAVIDANNVVTAAPLRDHAETQFFETATDMGDSDLFANDGSIGLDEPELDDVMFLDSLEEMQPDSYFTSQMEMSCNKSMSLEADDVPFDLDDNITDLKDVSMGELENSMHLSQLLHQSSDRSVPGGVPSETSLHSEPRKEQMEQPGDGMMMKDMAVASAIPLGLPFVVKFFRKMFFQADDDVPVANMADQGGTSSNSLTMSRSELMMSSAAQNSSRNGALYLDMQ
jgi:hypothetical protein